MMLYATSYFDFSEPILFFDKQYLGWSSL